MATYCRRSMTAQTTLLLELSAPEAPPRHKRSSSYGHPTSVRNTSATCHPPQRIRCSTGKLRCGQSANVRPAEIVHDKSTTKTQIKLNIIQPNTHNVRPLINKKGEKTEEKRGEDTKETTTN